MTRYPISTTADVVFIPGSEHPIELLTNDGHTGLTLNEAEQLIAVLVQAVGKAYKESYLKEVA